MTVLQKALQEDELNDLQSIVNEFQATRAARLVMTNDTSLKSKRYFITGNDFETLANYINNNDILKQYFDTQTASIKENGFPMKLIRGSTSVHTDVPEDGIYDSDINTRLLYLDGNNNTGGKLVIGTKQYDIYDGGLNVFPSNESHGSEGISDSIVRNIIGPMNNRGVGVGGVNENHFVQTVEQYSTDQGKNWLDPSIEANFTILQPMITNIKFYNIETLPDYVAYNTILLTTVIIPSSVKTIGYEAFAESGLISVIIPNSVESIYNHAFKNCKLTTITISSNLADLLPDVDGNLWNKIPIANITEIILEGDMTKLPDNMFANFRSIEHIIYKRNKFTIGEWNNLTPLERINLNYPYIVPYKGLPKIVKSANGNYGKQQTPAYTSHMKARSNVAGNFFFQKWQLNEAEKKERVNNPSVPLKPQPIINQSSGMHTRHKAGVKPLSQKNAGFAMKNNAFIKK